MILDLFAGPGGWSEGIRSLGIHDIGLEWDRDACLTRGAAGHWAVRADVAAYPTDPFVGRVEGLIASPPCQAFSMAGKGDGRAEIAHLHAAVEACRAGWVEPDREWVDERTPLILQPLRWAWALRPRWIACEQVPPAMPVWVHMADVLRSCGYSATAVVLSAEQYGVPQTRKRAFLLARLDGPVSVPKPTHQKYRPGEAQGVGCGSDLFGNGLLPWVSMAEALGWGMVARPTTAVVSHTPSKTGGSEPLNGGAWSREVYATERRVGRWLLRMAGGEKATERPAPAPAPAVVFGHDAASVKWVRTSFGEPHRGKEVGSPKPEFDPNEQPCRTINSKTADWVTERPATSVVGSFCPDIIAAPGYRTEVSRQDAEGSVRIEQHEAAILQGFPANYPFQGSKTSRFRQIGDAVPPPLARAVVAALTSRALALKDAA